MLFEIIIGSKIKDQLYLAQKFYALFEVQNKSLKKTVRFYKVESIDNPNMITITVKLKKYLEEYRNRGFNKKHKSERRNALGMNFDSYARRILALNGQEFVHCSKHRKQK